jgi:hypothetical protein
MHIARARYDDLMYSTLPGPFWHREDLWFAAVNFFGSESVSGGPLV